MIKMEPELEALRSAIVSRNDEQVFDLSIRSQNKLYPQDVIKEFLDSLSIGGLSCDLSVAGSGGSKVGKPNYSSLTCLYFAAAGYRSIKIGSHRRTGLFGSSDFFDLLGTNEFCFLTGGTMQYYNVNKAMLWHRYQNLLSLNHAFKDFFDSTIYNPVKYKVKVVGLLGVEKMQEYLSLTQRVRPDRLYTITSCIGNVVLDEATAGDVYVDGAKYCNWNSPLVELADEGAVREMDIGLLLGSENSIFSRYLIQNMAVILSLVEHIDIEQAMSICRGWYHSQIVLNKAVSNLKESLMRRNFGTTR